ncbi:ATP-Hypothetical protein region [Nesidiocoris tenuis]|uniref:Diphthine--ammonia ligase n=1 Tax=Nesidiocoris tenuis TaxID=355587 RepID=A0ABN7ANP1_9HEMI|nr:ATP-Hypothetical protein region [Nesidiocoris tenuis]
MKVVALISGGKDSCYNMLQCVMAGHEIVALANLKPDSKDELDSYMYQTVGHQGVELYAEAMNLPLFRQPTLGVALHSDKHYTPTPEDEVEDLYRLLSDVKEQISDVDAVSVGAVLSDYQRLRVENVCSRLGLVSLAYLWRRDQGELLQEMIDSHIDAMIIKVAALGLDPSKHLGMKIAEIQSHLIKMNEKYGLNICGEGGEYETFTLDCPLFCKSLVIDDYETVIHSNDAIAPVGYMNFTKIRLIDKEGFEASSSLLDRLKICSIKTAEDYITDIDQAEVTDTDSDVYDSDDQARDTDPLLEIKENEPTPCTETVVTNVSGWTWIGGVVGDDPDLPQATITALDKLKGLLLDKGLDLSKLVSVTLYVRDLSQYGAINSSYSSVIPGPNPPVRVALGTGLNEKTPVLLCALAYSRNKHVMHVQSLSHWAPANIGPYSQAIRIGDIIYVAGQIGLVPGSLSLVSGGIKRQCRLALRHVGRLIKAMDKETLLRNVVQGICYVTNPSYIREARREWERRTNNAIVEYVVVPELPKGAMVEWQIWAHRGNTRFEYEETGCVVGENRVSLKRRWNYDNTVSAIVCNISAVSSVSNPVISDSEGGGHSCESLSESQLHEVFTYALGRLFKGVPPPSCVQSPVAEGSADGSGEPPEITLSPPPAVADSSG